MALHGQTKIGTKKAPCDKKVTLYLFSCKDKAKNFTDLNRAFKTLIEKLIVYGLDLSNFSITHLTKKGFF